MHRQPSFTPEFPLGLRRDDLKTSLMRWGAYIALLTKELQDTLPPSQFVRVHRSYIVNIHEIDRISASRSGNDSIVLRSGRRINVGRKYRSQLLDSVMQTL